MSTEQTLQIESTSSEHTQAIAAKIGAKLKGGEVIVLSSDLGGGKTTFVKGLAKGAGSHDHVSSPSFTVSNQYKAAAKAIYHLDFYRLNEPGLMAEQLEEVISEENSIVVIEWANIVESILPEDAIKIDIQVTSEAARYLQIRYRPDLSYII